MTSGRKGIGSHKHGISGRAPKSPKMRMAMKLAAERAPPKPVRPKAEMKGTIKDLFK